MNSTKKIIDKLKDEYEFRFNLGNQRMSFRKLTENSYKYFTDCDFNSIRVNLGLTGIPCSKENLRSIIFSDQWPQYDPYKEFLAHLTLWDGHDYIADLVATVQTDDDEYWEWCLRKWLVATVGGWGKEKVVNQTAMIFCGKQGIGKSTWFVNILPDELKEYYGSGYLDPRDKESKVQLSELCLFNMDEVENLRAKNIESVKEFLTKPSMYFRRAYTTLSQNYPRRCSFCGTANGINILHDITGNRRFLCQNVLSIDYLLKGINHAQLYAQAYQLFRTGFQYWFDKKEQVIVEQHNARFRVTSLEEDLIVTYYEACQDGDTGSKRMQAHEITAHLQSKVPYAKLSPVTIGRILSSKGFVSKKSNGISKWVVREKTLLKNARNSM